MMEKDYLLVSNVDELVSKVSEINKSISKLQQQRIQLMERKRVARETLITKLDQYNKKHGTNFNVDDPDLRSKLEERYNDTLVEVNERAALASKVLAYLDAGDVVKAKELLGVVKVEPVTKKAAPKEAAPVAPSEEDDSIVLDDEDIVIEDDTDSPAVEDDLLDLGVLLEGTDFSV